MTWIDKLKKRWDIKSGWQVILILVVFALTGSSAVYVQKYAFKWLGVTSEDAIWLRILLWICIVLPAYQVILLIYGTLFGQFKFFWAFEKRMFNTFIPKSKLKSEPKEKQYEMEKVE